MTKKLILIFILSIVYYNPLISDEIDCNQFEKLSAKYIECNAKKLKKKASDKVEVSKKKIKESGIKDKFLKFKNKKTLLD